MRLLMFHVDSFFAALTEKGRSPLVEQTERKEIRVAESLLVLASVEKEDEDRSASVVQLALSEIAKLSDQLKSRCIVIHPFAHLFGDLARPDVALTILKDLEAGLSGQGYHVTRTPFGWFHSMEMRVKGHPLSRVARLIRAT